MSEIPWWAWIVIAFIALVVLAGGDDDNPHGDISMFGD